MAVNRAQIRRKRTPRGMTVDEALCRARTILDDALLAGLDLARVVHGKERARSAEACTTMCERTRG